MGPSGYELAKLIDLDRVQRLCDSLSEAFDVTLAVLDLSGNILIATGWQDICTRFHREHPETLRGCLESDLRINQRLVQGLDASEHYAYRCSNGLWDVAFPLVVGGEHVANVYTGQFFFEDDDVDREAFAERARRLGFDEDAYLEALDRVPVITQARLQKTIGFLSDFVGMLGELGLDRAAARAEARAAARERAALPAPVRQRRGGPHRLPRGAGRRRRGRGPRHRRHQPHAGAADQGPPRRGWSGWRLSECDDGDERLRAYFDVVSGAIAAGRPARCEVYLRPHGAYELLSAYPAADDLWVVSATDVTDLREAERALRRQEEGIRLAYVDVLDAVTGGKLILLTDEQLSDELGTPLAPQVVFGAPAQLATARRAIGPRRRDAASRGASATPTC